MKLLSVFFAILAVSLTATDSIAKPGDAQQVQLPLRAADGTTFATEDMTGPAQSSILDVRGFDYIVWYISYLSVSGTENIDFACNFGPTTDDVNYPAQSRAIDTGVATYNDYIVRKSVTTSKKFPVRIDVHRYHYIQCTWTGASGTVDASVYATNE